VPSRRQHRQESSTLGVGLPVTHSTPASIWVLMSLQCLQRRGWCSADYRHPQVMPSQKSSVEACQRSSCSVKCCDAACVPGQGFRGLQALNPSRVAKTLIPSRQRAGRDAWWWLLSDAAHAARWRVHLLGLWTSVRLILIVLWLVCDVAG
jgi:hypothetical protein